MIRRWLHQGHFVIRYSSTGLWYVDDRYGYCSLSAAKRRIERMVAEAKED